MKEEFEDTKGVGYSLVVNTSRSFPHSWLITGFITRVTWRVSLAEQVLFTLPVHLRSPLVFSSIRVARSLVFCVVCSSSLFVHTGDRTHEANSMTIAPTIRSNEIEVLSEAYKTIKAEANSINWINRSFCRLFHCYSFSFWYM
jgi:hypothetical protein